MNPEAKSSFTITRGFEQCIILYPLDQWEKREVEIARLNTYRSEARDFVRTIMRWADDVTLDAQGRIVVPRNLLDFANIRDTALIIGMLDHIEIWGPEVFESCHEESESDYPSLAERVLGMGA